MRAAAAGLVLLVACASTDSAPSDFTAWRVCTDRVESSLRAPGTADFPAMRHANISETVRGWTIQSYVDAENAFGGEVRTGWTCTLTEQGDGWRVQVAFDD